MNEAQPNRIETNASSSSLENPQDPSERKYTEQVADEVRKKKNWRLSESDDGVCLYIGAVVHDDMITWARAGGGP